MTLDEAKKIPELLETGAHGNNCGYCASDFADKANELFPEFKWDYQETRTAWEVTVEPK